MFTFVPTANITHATTYSSYFRWIGF